MGKVKTCINCDTRKARNPRSLLCDECFRKILKDKVE